MELRELRDILIKAEEAKEILLSMQYKMCPMCKEVLPLDRFNRAAASKDGRYSYCLDCAKMQRDTYRASGQRVRPRKPYVNQTRPSEHKDCIEVKMHGNNDLWMILDIDVFETYSDFKFYTSFSPPDNYYCQIKPETKAVRLHRLICPTRTGYEVDHINRNPLDNRRANLREVTRAENLLNRRPFDL